MLGVAPEQGGWSRWKTGRRNRTAIAARRVQTALGPAARQAGRRAIRARGRVALEPERAGSWRLRGPPEGHPRSVSGPAWEVQGPWAQEAPVQGPEASGRTLEQVSTDRSAQSAQERRTRPAP